MMTRELDKKREQIQFFSMDDMVPKNHLLRLIEQSIDFDFIYDLVEDRYCLDNGRPSIDPVMLIKIQLIQCLYGIRSMRQTIKDIDVNVAYRWFLGLSMLDKVPHFTTFGKNYTRRFKDTDLYEKIFERILEECFSCGFVDDSTVFIDATHIKAAANNKKFIKKEGPHGNEGRADVCVHESQETGKDEAKIWPVKAIRQTLFIAFFRFYRIIYGRKKTRSENRLKSIFKTWFVFSLNSTHKSAVHKNKFA